MQTCNTFPVGYIMEALRLSVNEIWHSYGKESAVTKINLCISSTQSVKNTVDNDVLFLLVGSPIATSYDMLISGHKKHGGARMGQ